MGDDQVTVVVPTYNERENLEAFVGAVLTYGYRVLIVDDGSPDGTGALADTLSSVEKLLIRHDIDDPPTPARDHPEHIFATVGLDNIRAVPEPATWVSGVVGVFVFGLFGWRKRLRA